MEPMDALPLNAAVTDTKARKALADYVAANRQYLPPVKRLELLPIPEPESGSDREERELAEARRADMRRRAELLERFNSLVYAAGARYRECTLENFTTSHPQQKRILGELLGYVAGDTAAGVILYGPIGTGKDHLAFALCRCAIRAGKTVKWVNGQSWYGSLRDAIDSETSEATLIADLARPDLLCISDPLPPVGVLTPYQASMLYRLVDARYSRGKPTICTVNVHNDADADARMGEATWDRLCHDSWKLHCNWPSYRRATREIR